MAPYKMAYGKYSTWNRKISHPQKMVPYKNGTPCKKMRRQVVCQGLSWVISKKKFLNLLCDSDSWSWDFKVQSDIPVTLLCLIVGVGSISKVMVVLQKANNVVLRCHFCEMPFMLGAIFVRCYFWPEECPFCNNVSVGAINVRCL